MSPEDTCDELKEDAISAIVAGSYLTWTNAPTTAGSVITSAHSEPLSVVKVTSNTERRDGAASENYRFYLSKNINLRKI